MLLPLPEIIDRTEAMPYRVTTLFYLLPKICQTPHHELVHTKICKICVYHPRYLKGYNIWF